MVYVSLPPSSWLHQTPVVALFGVSIENYEKKIIIILFISNNYLKLWIQFDHPLFNSLD